MTVLQTPQSLGGKDRAAAGYFDEINSRLISLQSQVSTLAGGEEADVAALTTWPPLYKQGLITSRASATSLTVGVGGCSTDIGGARSNLTVASAITKTLTTFVEGSGSGGLTSGLAASTWYFVFVVVTASGASDVIFDTSPTSPALPSGFTKARRIGSFLTDSASEITAYVQSGNRFLWETPPFDVNVTSTTTSAVSRVLTVPLGIVTRAILSVYVQVLAGGSSVVGLISPLSLSDVSPATASNIAGQAIAAAGNSDNHYIECDTDTGQQIRTRMSASGVNNALQIYTFGWFDYFGETT